MTSLKQIEANRLNAIKSTGPRTDEGKRRSRLNAVRHGLAAETVIAAFENAADYASFERRIASDYQITTATDEVLVSRLASVLWRLRRSTSIETGMFQLQGELMGDRKAGSRRGGRVDRPDWYDEFDVGSPSIAACSPASQASDGSEVEDLSIGKELACCFLRMSRLQYGTFELLTRYETALWRQAAQLAFMLQPRLRR